MIAAIFDVDRTILPATSAERLFLRYLWRTDRLGWWTVMRMARYALFHLSDTAAGRADRIYLRGQPVAIMESAALACWQTEILPRISATALQTVEAHRQQAHAIVLLTGAPDLLVEPLARHLKADASLCSVLERAAGTRIAGGEPVGSHSGAASPQQRVADRYTGRIVPPHPYGTGKRETLDRFARERGVDLSASFAYADSLTDLPVLERVGHPTVINPTALFRRHAEQRGWPVEEWA